jgi:Fe-S-cluster containining protein
MKEINCPKACGKCCEVIMINKPKSKCGIDLQIMLERISRKKAKALNPEIPIIKDYYYYTCRWFDRKSHLCFMYNSRPYMCRYYPFYEKVVVDASVLHKDCYWANQIMKKVDNI